MTFPRLDGRSKNVKFETKNWVIFSLPAHVVCDVQFWITWRVNGKIWEQTEPGRVLYRVCYKVIFIARVISSFTVLQGLHPGRLPSYNLNNDMDLSLKMVARFLLEICVFYSSFFFFFFFFVASRWEGCEVKINCVVEPFNAWQGRYY